MNKKKSKQAGRLYFTQTDWMRPVGAVLLIVGIIWFWVGFTMASYYGPIIMVPVGLVLFFIGSTRHISDNDIIGEIDHLLLDYDKSVTEMADYDRKVLKQPSDVVIETYSLGKGASLFRRNKNSTVISDIFVRSHFFFTKDELLVCARRVCLTEMDTEAGLGATDIGGRFAFADIFNCRLEEKTDTVTLANTKKPATVHLYELVLEGQAGEILRLPVKNDMDSSTLCEEIKRRI